MFFRDRAFIKLETVDSTNNYAANLIKLSSPPDGTVITAQEQTHGKGQRGSFWKAHKGENLLMTMIVYPKVLEASNMFLLSQIAALAAKETFETLCEKDVLVKWPNDIYAENKKLGGILIEFNWVDGKIQSAVIGWGLNINQRGFDLPKATSLRILSEKYTPLDFFRDALIKNFDVWYTKLHLNQHDEIRREYFHYLFRKNEFSIYSIKENIITARILGVTSAGLLQLEGKDGLQFEVDVKEITFVL